MPLLYKPIRQNEKAEEAEATIYGVEYNIKTIKKDGDLFHSLVSYNGVRLVEALYDEEYESWHLKVAGGLHDAYNWYIPSPNAEGEEIPEYLNRRNMATHGVWLEHLMRILMDLFKEDHFEMVFGSELYNMVYGDE